MKFLFEDAGVSQSKREQLVGQLQGEIQRLVQAREQEYVDPYSFIRLPDDDHYFESIRRAIERKKHIRPTLMVVVGIGGSNMGTLAIHQALNGYFYNELNPPVRFLCADTIDGRVTFELLTIIKSELQRGGRVLAVIVSKSGKTAETLINASLISKVIKAYHTDTYRDYVVILSDKQSPLWQLGVQEELEIIEIPKAVGGRYSVFSAVGLFPLGLLNIDLKQLRAGACKAVQDGTRFGSENYAALRAAILYAQYQNGCVIHDMFVCTPELTLFGGWYRQLMGESIGKRNDKNGVEIRCGIVPTISVGTIDLHSVLQLNLAGPRNRMTTMVMVEQGQDIPIPANVYTHLDVVGAGSSVRFVQKTISDSVYKSYQQEQQPCMGIVLPRLDAFEIGYLMQMHMIEMVYLGYLCNINVFDQPQVEGYKKETHAVLSKTKRSTA